MTVTASWWDVATQIHTMLTLAGTGYCLCCMVRPLVQTQKKKPFIARHVSAVSGAVYFFTMLILYYIPYNMPGFFAYAVGSLMSFAVLCALDKKQYGQKFLLSAMFFVLRWLTAIMAVSLYSLVWRFLYMCGYFEAGDMGLQFLCFLGIDTLELILSLVFLRLSVCAVCRLYRYKDEELMLWEVSLFMIPTFMSVTDYGLRQYFTTIYVTELGVKYTLYDFLDFLHSSSCTAVILSVIWLYSRLKRQQEESKQEELLGRQMEDMRRHISEVEGLYQDIRSLKHDMGNHLQMIDGLYESGEALAAKEYAAKLQSQFLAATEDIKTGNPVTDVLLSGYCQQMRECAIDYKCQFRFPIQSKIEAFELSVIVSNALDNAIEASRECERPFIRISSHQRKQVYFLEVENRFVGERTFDFRRGLPMTTKQGAGHGYGLDNIRRTARKYYGDVEVSMEDEVFRLRIMLCG